MRDKLVDEPYLDTLAGQLDPSLQWDSAYAIFVWDQHALLPMAIRLSLWYSWLDSRASVMSCASFSLPADG